MSWTVGEKRGYRGMKVPSSKESQSYRRSAAGRADRASEGNDQTGRRLALVQPLVGIEPVVPAAEAGVEVDPVAAPLQAEADVGREQDLHAAAEVAGEAVLRLDLREVRV